MNGAIAPFFFTINLYFNKYIFDCYHIDSYRRFSQKLGGGSFQLIGDTIESYFTGTAINFHFGAALSLVLMVLILLSMAVMNRFTDEETAMERRPML